MVIVDANVGTPYTGENVTVKAEGAEAERAICELKPPTTVAVTVNVYGVFWW